MSTYLVTGGAGFIGSAIVRELVARGERVRVLDDLSTGHRRNLGGVEDRVELIIGSINDTNALSEAVHGVRYVLHQAAVVSVPYSIRHTAETHEVNVEGTDAVVRWAASAGVERVVVASSCAVYGQATRLPALEGQDLDPRSPYAVSKFGAENVALDAAGVEAVALRYFNVYGPRQDPASQYAAVIPRFVRAHLDREPVTVFGDGLQTRDFCFVSDVVRANLLACSAPEAAGGVFNVGTGVETSLMDLLDSLRQYVGYGVDVMVAPERAGDVRRSRASMELAREQLGFEARTGLGDGLTATVEWTLSQ